MPCLRAGFTSLAWILTSMRATSTDEGSEQLSARAKHAEEERDLAAARYHHFELGSAAFQIAIVLASTTIITGVVALAWISGLLALAGIVIGALGAINPQILPLY